MQKTELNTAIAKARGWRNFKTRKRAGGELYITGESPSGYYLTIPNYTGDLNDLRPIEDSFEGGQFIAWCRHLYNVVDEDIIARGDFSMQEILEPVEIAGVMALAPAHHRAIAVAKTLGVWKETT